MMDGRQAKQKNMFEASEGSQCIVVRANLAMPARLVCPSPWSLALPEIAHPTNRSKSWRIFAFPSLFSVWLWPLGYFTP